MNAENNTVDNPDREVEAHFGIQELFVSFTDKKGKITSGNDVFVRVSGYPREKLMGSPHNIIRHPDMPKCIFKLLWDTIQSGNPIMAYVKNKSIDGLPYWVFATVLPIQSGYLSMRIKPGSPIFTVIRDLYPLLLEEEKIRGIPGSTKLLDQKLKELGFNSYFQFMLAAGSAELKNKDSQTQLETKKNTSKNSHILAVEFEAMNQLCNKNIADFKSILDFFSAIQNKIPSLSSNILKISQAAKSFESLAVNMSISSHRLGTQGATLSVVANSFDTSSKILLKTILEFEKDLTGFVDGFPLTHFNLLTLRLQNEMLAFFTEEIFLKSTQFEPKKLPYLVAVQRDLDTLVSEVRNYFQNEAEHATELSLIASKLLTLLKKCKNVTQNLDVVRLGGKLESSVDSRLDQSFTPYIKEMVKFVGEAERPLNELIEVLEGASHFFENLQKSLRENLVVLLQMELRKNRISFIEPDVNPETRVA